MLIIFVVCLGPSMAEPLQISRQNDVQDILAALHAIEAAVADHNLPVAASPTPHEQGFQRRDLAAQEDMAFYAQAMFWVSFITAAVTIISLLMLYRTISASIEAERPHVRLFTTIKEKDEDGRILSTIGINFRNYGRTPALVKKLSICYKLADSPPNPEECKVARNYPDDSVMAQDEPWPYRTCIGQLQGTKGQ
ncbi:hypothetical protein [Devosia riboflavina]